MGTIWWLLTACAQGQNLFVADAAFAQPELYVYLEAEGFEYAIRLPANDALLQDIAPLLTRPVGRPSNTPVVWCAGFLYQAKSWNRQKMPQWTLKKTCKSMKQDENEQITKKGTAPVVGWKTYGKCQ